jgi:isoleucyl-tRNA synthetase
MSKSLGNVTAPQDVTNQLGADILRLWVVASDYTQDLSVGPNILKQMGDLYRRLRNTLRYLLGNLSDFGEGERVPLTEMPELERWVLHRTWELDQLMRKSIEEFDFHGLFNELHNFCAVDLSAFYFDIRKDSLYCDAPESLRRRACRTVLDTLYDCLVKWLAPFICFTAEEAWLVRHPGSDISVHLEQFPDVPAAWRDDALAAKWAKIRTVRRVVTGALEHERAAKRIGASLQAHPQVWLSADLMAAVKGRQVDDICITSGVAITEGGPPAEAYTLADVPGVGVVVETAAGEKCERCWKVLSDVGTHSHAGVCNRCDEAVETISAAAK